MKIPPGGEPGGIRQGVAVRGIICLKTEYSIEKAERKRIASKQLKSPLLFDAALHPDKWDCKEPLPVL